MKYVLIFILGLAIHFPLKAEEKPISLNENAWEQLSSEVEFENPDQTKKKKEKKKKDKITTAPKNSWRLDPGIMRPLLFGIIIAIILVVLIYLIYNSRTPHKVKANRTMATSLEEAEEKLPDVELDHIYQNALDNADLRSALRVRFLMVLQALLDAQLIEWRKRKTNEQYLMEIRDPNMRPPFAFIVDIFDNTWYGNNLLTTDIFETASNKMMAFKSQIESHAQRP